MHNPPHHSSVGLWQKRLVLATIIVLPTIYLTLLDFFGDKLPLGSIVIGWTVPLLFILATIALFYLGLSFFYSTMRGLRQHIFNMDSLVTIGTTIAYAYSWLSYLLYIINNQTFLVSRSADDPRFYFNTVVFLFAFVVLGKWLEARATSRTERSIRQLIKLRPVAAHLITTNNSTVSISTTKIKVGDRLLIRPGEVIPIDGQVTNGESAVDESMITGESVAIDKYVGSQVLAGTTNKHGQLQIVAQKDNGDTMLAKIIRLIKNAQASRTTTETMTDRIANVFVPFVIMIALVTFAVWYFYVGVDASSAMIMFVTVIMVACPCAFGLASPTAVTVGINLGSKNGILIKSSTALQQLSLVDTVIFDKTGTLTTGQPVITDIVAVKENAKKALTIASSLVRNSDYSLDKAIATKAASQHLETLPAKHVVMVAGSGLRGTINGVRYYLGNEQFTKKHFRDDLPDVTKFQTAGKTINYLFRTHQLLAIIAISDQPKPGAARTIKQLHQMGITTCLLSGDSYATTRAIARRLGIKDVVANVVPDAKADQILELREQGDRVVMVGDGVNDAPAMASANIGIAIGTGTDAAIETGDVVLVTGDPLGVCSAIRLARVTTSKVRQNLFFALFYNVISIPLAAGALSYWGISLQPELAGLIMAMSSVAIIANSLTLKLTTINKPHEPTSVLAPAILFLLFTAVYLSFVFS